MPSNMSSVIASALPSLEVCPSYTGGEAGDAAAFGSAFHLAMETGEIAHALTPEALDAAKAGQGMERKDIEEAFAWAQQFKQTMLQKYSPRAEYVEIEGSIDMIPGRRFFIDWLLDLGDGAYIVVDWKTGRSIYDATDNLQGICYAMALMQQDIDCDRVGVIFVTPFTQGIYHHTFERDDADKLVMRLYNVIQAAAKENPAANPGSACKYCGRFNNGCPAIKATVEDTKTGALEKRLENAITVRSPEDMGKLLDLCPVLERIAKDIKDAANNMRFQQGLEIPGYKVVHSSSKTKIAEPSEIFKYLMSQGLDLDAALTYIQFSMADVEKAVGACSPRGEREKVLQSFRDRGWLTGGQGDGSPYLRKIK